MGFAVYLADTGDILPAFESGGGGKGGENGSESLMKRRVEPSQRLPVVLPRVPHELDLCPKSASRDQLP